MINRPDLLVEDETQSEKLKWIANKAKTDYYFLCKEILGYKDIRPYPHQDLCDMLDRVGKRKKLILLPRGAFKSSVITVGGAIRRMIRNPNIRILISSETQIKSQAFVGEIKAHIEQNPKFRAIFGDWVSEDKAWREGEITINRRTQVLKEPTVTAASLEKMSSIGYHYDMIILDDVVSPLNVNTQEQLEKTIKHYTLLLSVLDPGFDKEIWVVGTRWHLSDLYGWIEDPQGQEREQFEIFVKAAVEPDGKLLLPDRLNKEYLEDQRKTQGDFLFSCNYLLRPINSDTATFQKEHVRIYQKAPGREGLYFFMTVDPAVSLKTTADYTGIIVNGVDYEHNWWIHEAIQRRLELSDLIEMIFYLCDKYQPMMCLGLEKYALEKLLMVNLQQEMIKRNRSLPIKEIPTDNRVSKEHRIKALEPKFQAGKIYIKEEHEALKDQIIFHPQVKHDDLLDALKSQLAITFPGPLVEAKPEEKWAHLTQKEQKIWKHVQELGETRKVRRTKGFYI